jgi:hypothetical protein
MKVFGCPFSDRNFVLATISFERTVKQTVETLIVRKLTEVNIVEIVNQFEKLDFSFIESPLDMASYFLFRTFLWRFEINIICQLKSRE